MQRWQLDVPPGILTRRIPRTFERLSKLVPPRVLAACWRTIWNGWCTDERFRNLERRWWTKPCVLKCSTTAEDSIKHYARCPRILDFGRRYLGLDPGSCTLLRMLSGEAGLPDEMLIMHAILMYSVFRTTSALRHKEAVWNSMPRKTANMYVTLLVNKILP